MSKPILVTFKNGDKVTVLEVSPNHDPFEVCERARRRIFPGVELLVPDERFELAKKIGISK